MYEPAKGNYQPWPKSRQELDNIIDNIISAEHDYNTSAEAATDAAVAAFNYVSSELGLTGFQAGWAGMQFIKRTKAIEGPFMIIKIEDALYPQYDIKQRVQDYLEECKPWLKEQAQKKLDELDLNDTISLMVWEHWEKLANES